MNKPVILLVNADRNEMEMLAKELQEEGFDIVRAVTSDELDHIIHNRYIVF
jgi:DNA-binding response OmpR family regulator